MTIPLGIEEEERERGERGIIQERRLLVCEDDHDELLFGYENSGEILDW